MKGNNNISSEAALKLLKAAEEKSRDLGVKMNIAVVDSGANLVGFLRSVLPPWKTQPPIKKKTEPH